VDVGPAPGSAALGPRNLPGERVVAYVSVALQLAFQGADPAESLALARSGAQTTDGGPEGQLLRVVDGLLARAQSATLGEGMEGLLGLFGALGAAFVAATPSAGVPVLDA
jgi:hypothetical protein